MRDFAFSKGKREGRGVRGHSTGPKGELVVCVNGAFSNINDLVERART